jgi:DNA-binding NarL/FixJ family response regulator
VLDDAHGAETAPGVIRVAVFAPYPALRAGLRALLGGSAGIAVTAELRPGDPLPAGDDIDVFVGDPVDGGVTRLPEFEDGAAVLLVSDPAPFRELLSRPGGTFALLLPESPGDAIVAAIEAVHEGLTVIDPGLLASILAPERARLNSREPEPLTEREHEVLSLVALGLPNKQIAAQLGISEHTAKFHVGAILGKLNAASRTEAVMIAAKRGWLAL